MASSVAKLLAKPPLPVHCEDTSASSSMLQTKLRELQLPPQSLLLSQAQLATTTVSLLSTMRFLPLLASASALVASAFAAEQSTEERFIKFNRLARLSSPLQLNDVSYKSLTSTPRDYSVAIVLTAQDARFGCQLCRDFKPEWELIAQSWARGDKQQESRLFFGVLDFTEGRETFLSVWKTAG